MPTRRSTIRCSRNCWANSGDASGPAQADDEHDDTPAADKKRKDGGTSLKTQSDHCEQYAAEHGYKLLGVYRDVHTGAEYRERPALSELRALVRAGGVDVVIAYALDRLSRNQAHLYIIAEEVEAAGGRLEFVTEDFEDSAVGRFMRSAKAFAAEVEREKIAERSARGKRARVEAGRLLPGCKPPFGYRWSEDHNKLEVNDAEALIVRRMFSDYAAGGTLRSVANKLTADGIPRPRQGVYGAGGWSVSTVRGMLTNRTYLGEVVSHGTIKLPDGTAPALIEPGQFEAVQRRLSVNQQRAKRNAKYPDEAALLRGGLAKCGVCGSNLMVIKHSKQPGYFYACTGQNRGQCGRHAMMTHNLDGEVWERIRWLMTADEALEILVDGQALADPAAELATIDRTLSGLKRQRENLLTSVATAEDADTVEVLTARLDQLAARCRELDTERAAVARQAERLSLAHQTVAELDRWRRGVAKVIDVMTIAERRDLLDLLAVRAQLWPIGHEPRWLITSEIIPSIVCSSSRCSSSVRPARRSPVVGRCRFSTAG